MKRREAREAAFLLIFEKMFRDEAMADIIAAAQESRAVELDDYSESLVLKVEQLQQALDESIERYLDKWKITRIPKVTLSVLRLAFCELMHFPDIPVKVTINEAVELAKKYATEDDASYINGVLGSFVRENPPVKDEDAKEE